MIGETEVLHQFKVFAAGLPAGDVDFREVGQALLADARTIRARYLTGLGSRSYGSAVRRLIGDVPRVALAGTGMLARQVAPFLIRQGREIDLWGRRTHVDGFDPALVYRLLSAPAHPPIDGETALVIAAPLSSRDIAALAARYCRPAVLIDLRAEGAQDPPPPLVPIVTLTDVFAGFEAARRAADSRVLAAREAIRRCADAFATRAKLNPSGWHDLCA
jgi:hypothetical protein